MAGTGQVTPQQYGSGDPADDPQRKQAEATLAKLAAKLNAAPQGQKPADPRLSGLNGSGTMTDIAHTGPGGTFSEGMTATNLPDHSNPQTPDPTKPAPPAVVNFGNQPAATPPVDPIIARLTDQLTKKDAQADTDQAAADAMTIGPAPTYTAPQYEKPNKTQEIIAGALALLFPGSKAGIFASNYLKGMQQGADSRYQRAEDEAKTAYDVANNQRQAQLQEKQMAEQKAAGDDSSINRTLTEMNVREGQIERAEAAAARQTALNAQNQFMDGLRTSTLRERIRADDNLFQTRANNTKIALGRLGVAQGNLTERITNDAKIDARVKRGQNMTFQTAAANRDLRAQITVLTTNSANWRNTNTVGGAMQRAELEATMRSLAPQFKTIDDQTSDALKKIYANDDLSDDQKKTQADAVVQSGRDALDKLTTPLVSKYPSLGQALDTIKGQTQQEVAGYNAGANADAESLADAQSRLTLGLAPEESGGSGGGSSSAPAAPNISISIGGKTYTPDGVTQSDSSTTETQPAVQMGQLGTVALAKNGLQPPPDMIQGLAQLYVANGGDPKLALQSAYVMANESGGVTTARNKEGAVGLAQILSPVHPQFDPNKLTDPNYNVKAMISLQNAAIKRGQDPFEDWADSKDKGAYNGWDGVYTPPGGQTRGVGNYDYLHGATGAAGAAVNAATSGKAPADMPQGLEESYAAWTHDEREEFLNNPRAPQDVKAYLKSKYGSTNQLPKGAPKPAPAKESPAAAAAEKAKADAASRAISDASGGANNPFVGAENAIGGAIKNIGNWINQHPATPNTNSQYGGQTTPQPSIPNNIPGMVQGMARQGMQNTLQTPPGLDLSPKAQNAPQPLSQQAQALQATKSKQLLPFAQMLVRSKKPPQQAVKLLEGRGLSPTVAQQLYQQAVQSLQQQQPPPQPAA